MLSVSALKHLMSNKTPGGASPWGAPERRRREQTAVDAFLASAEKCYLQSFDLCSVKSYCWILLHLERLWAEGSILISFFLSAAPESLPQCFSPVGQMLFLFQLLGCMSSLSGEWVTGLVCVVSADVQVMLVTGCSAPSLPSEMRSD